MSTKKVLVLGGNFAGLTAALSVKHEFGNDVDETFESHGVEFVHGEATNIDPKAKKVETSQGMHAYDYLVIATGYLNDFDVIPGLGPEGNAYSITSLDGAVDAAEGWARFVIEPGPVVVG